ncbi:MAG: sugar transferase [Patescibacteria group bacterium]|mgnify:CR=1 FL=1
MPSYETIKRMFDFTVVLIALILTSPVFLLVAVLIKLDSDGPVLYIKERIGQGGRPFKFLKFRTMVKGADKIGLGIADGQNDPRITGIGRFLRDWTIDEMPQFINVLKGDMSLVGPRPWIAYEGNNPKMKSMWQKKISVKPGLVSLVDMKGRNLLAWEERLKYDSWYIDNQSFWLDLKILVLGFFAVLSRKGVYGRGGANPNIH